MPDSAEPQRGPLARLVDTVLGIPQPGHYHKQEQLQDKLLPEFQEDARVYWFLSWPHVSPQDLTCVYDFVSKRTENMEADYIPHLKYLLEEMGVFDLLDAAAESPDLPILNERSPEHEVRILRQSGHPRAAEEFERMLQRGVAEPTKLSKARNTLDQAAHVINGPQPIRPYNADKRQLSGRGNIFSGLVLLAANGAISPTVLCSQEMSLALLSSFAGGIVMMDKGIEDLSTS